jgi:hypothetical protein
VAAPAGAAPRAERGLQGAGEGDRAPARVA